ncbi:MAG: YibE/F family protein [Acidimicrobiales bacterium]
MGSGHSHVDDLPSAPAAPRVRLVLTIALAPFALAVLVGLVVLWPHQGIEAQHDLGPPPELVDATVVRTELRPCASGLDQLAPDEQGVVTGPRGDCSVVTVRPDAGPEQGQELTLPDFALSAGAPDLRAGDTVVVGRSVNPLDLQVQYYFSDVQRSRALWLLGAVFALFVVGIARWKGVTSLVGLVFTYLVLVVFMLPALVAGESPLLVALTASGLIMFVVLYLAHGFNVRTSTALLGTLVSLGLTGVLAAVFVELTRLSGVSSEEATFVKAQIGDVDLQGLLLAGIIIGALGVLNDVTVTQASAAFEIHQASPGRGARAVYRSAMRVGRDHIASVVDTLVLAYAGASLPLLILFVLGEQGLSRILSSTIVAEEIVRTLVGSIGLVASVPVTTALAAVVAGSAVAVTAGGGARDGSDDHDGQLDDGHRHEGPRPDDGPEPDDGPRHDLDLRDPHDEVDAVGDEPSEPGRRRARDRRIRRAGGPSRSDDWQPPRAERDFWDS